MLTKSEETTRIQLLITNKQKNYLEQHAKLKKMSVSALMRNFIDENSRKLQEKRLEMAVDNLYSEYGSNDDLTAFTALDGEDFYEPKGSVADKS